MTLEETMKELESYKSETTKKILIKHGAREPFWGVKIGDLKKVLKKTKKDHELAMKLYETGNSDAMYLAGLMADPKKMTKEEIEKWAKKAYWYMLSEYTVAGVAAESPYGLELAREWIKSQDEMTASAGWATYCGIIAIQENSLLDLEEINSLTDTIIEKIHQSQNRVKYCMNSFIINAGGYIPELREKAIEAAKKIGKVNVNMGKTSCKVPEAVGYINKMLEKADGAVKKRKTIRC